MSSRHIATPVALALAALVAGTTVAGAQSGSLSATLSGRKELAKGAGKGTFSASFRKGKLCYTLKFTGAPNPIAAHIHKGTAKQEGPIVVDLVPQFRNGRSARCVTAAAKTARAIRKNPGRYYVNVHTKKFPNGTMRGQLHH